MHNKSEVKTWLGEDTFWKDAQAAACLVHDKESFPLCFTGRAVPTQ